MNSIIHSCSYLAFLNSLLDLFHLHLAQASDLEKRLTSGRMDRLYGRDTSAISTENISKYVDIQFSLRRSCSNHCS